VSGARKSGIAESHCAGILPPALTNPPGPPTDVGDAGKTSVCCYPAQRAEETRANVVQKVASPLWSPRCPIPANDGVISQDRSGRNGPWLTNGDSTCRVSVGVGTANMEQ
jgi:hypothetical protein